LPGRLPPLPDRADDRQVPAALVRRRSGGLDDLHALLPAPASRRLSLCGPRRAAPPASPREVAPSRSSLRRPGRDAPPRPALEKPDPAVGRAEDSRRGASDRAPSRPARGRGRPAVPAPLFDGAARPGLGGPHAPARPRVSPLRPLQRRVSRGPGDVSVPLRARLHDPRPGLDLVGRLSPLRSALVVLRNALSGPRTSSPRERAG